MWCMWVGRIKKDFIRLVIRIMVIVNGMLVMSVLNCLLMVIRLIKVINVVMDVLNIGVVMCWVVRLVVLVGEYLCWCKKLVCFLMMMVLLIIMFR